MLVVGKNLNEIMTRPITYQWTEHHTRDQKVHRVVNCCLFVELVSRQWRQELDTRTDQKRIGNMTSVEPALANIQTFFLSIVFFKVCNILMF